MSLSLHDKIYLRDFSIDKPEIGELLGHGKAHNVYEYGDREVVKIPRFHLLYPGATPDDQKRDMQFVERNFMAHALPSSIHTDKNGRKYYIKQQEVDSQNLSPHEAPEIIEQLMAILAKNRELVRNLGISLDFLGLEGVKKCLLAKWGFKSDPQMSNLVVTENEFGPRIVIPDFTVLRLRDDPKDDFRHKMRKIIFRYAFRINRALILKHWEEDIAQ